MSILFKNVTIIGVGLIGGSVAKCLKSAGLAGVITGAGRSRETLELALRLGVIDRMGHGSKHAVEDADLVVLAAPVGTFEETVRDISAHLKEGSILTDVGSVKGGLVRKIEELLPPGVHYVPGHPIAGKEKHGVAEASDTLFRGAKCILTPTGRTDAVSLERVKSFWTAAGAQVLVMQADIHDHVFAAVSHLPHAAAFAMVAAVAECNADEQNYLAYAGAGFRDFTRIAASSPEVWRDICLMNGPNIVEMIERYQFSLNRIKKAIQHRDAERLEKLFHAASELRKGLNQRD